MSTINACLRTLCDYVVACSVDSTAGAGGGGAPDELMANKTLDALCSFCVSWRIIPLDRLLLFLVSAYSSTRDHMPLCLFLIN
ncbi:unnamed protein product [Echinostoma caproni]|uniref:Secreted protein n=1 Tax=Echinostoma caproni TaxID=27848 RepID=A0A183BC57_9TREM|nr:unnamed protein product [Echinostoma caproni]